MAQILQTIDVDVPVRTAYNQWTQFEEFPRFLTFVQSITQTDDTHSHWIVTIAGADREFDTVITEQLPDERIAWTSTGGEVDHAGVITFHRLSDAGSRLAVPIEWEPQGVLENVASAVGLVDRSVSAELKNFKEFIEDRGTA